MRFATAMLELATGLAYVGGIGGLVASDVWREWRRGRGLDMFGLCLVLVALACGPHHLHIGLHLLASRDARVDPTEALSMALALPFGAVFLAFRSERILSHGLGDRISAFRPWWIDVAWRALYLVLGFVLGSHLPALARGGWDSGPAAIPQLAQAALYVWVGLLLWTAQKDRHAEGHGWSASGFSLAMVFPTCALTHLTFALLILRGVVEPDWHLAVVDTYGVIVAAWYVWLIRRAQNEARGRI